MALTRGDGPQTTPHHLPVGGVDEVEESATREPGSGLSRNVGGRLVHVDDPAIDSNNDDGCRQMVDDRTEPGVDATAHV